MDTLPASTVAPGRIEQESTGWAETGRAALDQSHRAPLCGHLSHHCQSPWDARSQPRWLPVAVLRAYIRGLLLEVDRTLNQELGGLGSS